jgi:hypothetical protein
MFIAKPDNIANPLLSRRPINNGFPVLTRGAHDPLVNFKENTMHFLAIIFLTLFVSSVSYGQDKVDLSNVGKMVTEKQYVKALKAVSPCLTTKSVKEISNLEECLYFGEEVAIKAFSDLSIKYRKLTDDMAKSTKIYDQNFYIKKTEKTDELFKPYIELGLSASYNEIVDSCTYQHEFFKALNDKFPNSKYQEEVEYVLMDEKASVNDWEQWISDLEQYIKRHPTGKYSIRAKLVLASNYSDLWNLILPDHDWSFLVVEFPKDAKLANSYKQKALTTYGAILNSPDKSLLQEQEINDIKKRISDLNMNKASGGVGILRGYD